MRKYRKQFSRFHLCDSLLSCFSVTMIALQLAQLEKGAAKGLCLEFILYEYVKALSMDQKLASASPREKLKILEKLFADSLSTSVLQEPGVLDKLCFYCEALVQTSKTGEKLLSAIDELRQAAALPRSVLSREMGSISPVSLSVDALLSKLHDSLVAFFPLLASVLQASLDCETALFTLLELRAPLNSFLGADTVENLLMQWFPEGPQVLRQSISNGFSRRGFGDICPHHEDLFKGLTWQPHTIPAPKP